jgi:thioredoxin-related protein
MSVLILKRPMKKYVFLLLIGAFSLSACKSKKNAAASATSDNTSTTAAMTTRSSADNTGKVSHQYRATGCPTVIVFTKDGSEITLIPKDKIPAEFDVDGMEVKFNYHSLKMANPVGCTVGMPAEITDISKAK